MSRRLVKRVIISTVLMGLAVGAFYLIRFAAIAVMWASVLYGRDIMDASAINSRGDKVIAETNFFGAPEHRSKTVISLRRADHWFSTTLIESRSSEVLVGLHWQDDDTLHLQLEFGCDARTSQPVTKVGPINIVYRFGDPGYTPKRGYESFRRRDMPRDPC
jgi:hypothetical protein